MIIPPRPFFLSLQKDKTMKAYIIILLIFAAASATGQVYDIRNVTTNETWKAYISDTAYIKRCAEKEFTYTVDTVVYKRQPDGKVSALYIIPDEYLQAVLVNGRAIFEKYEYNFYKGYLIENLPYTASIPSDNTIYDKAGRGADENENITKDNTNY